MGTSINTAILPPIPLSRRVINDTEEHQRRVLDSYVEGINRGMNTSPVQSLDKQQEEITTTSKGKKPVITQADLQEETLQQESPEAEDTGMKQADSTYDQDPTYVQAQDVDKMRYQLQKIPANSRYKLPIQFLRLMMNNKIQIYLKIRCLEHHKMIIIELPLMMMSRTTQYNLAIQLPNCSCQEVSEYPEVDFLSFTQILQDYVRAYPPPTHADAYSQIQHMAQQLDVYLRKYPAH